MIETKLILIEGLPGSGKSTTAHKLAALLTDGGLSCRYFLEWDPDNPISIGDEAHLAEVVASSIAREDEVLQQWRALAQAGAAAETITILESRFWQTTLMLMYAAGRSAEALLASNRQVIGAIRDLKPALIYFAVDDPKAFFRRTIEIKNEEWRRAGQSVAWVDHVFSAFAGQQRFVEGGLAGLEGGLQFMADWATVAEALYDQTPFPKVKLRNPHHDWSLAMADIQTFLELA